MAEKRQPKIAIVYYSLYGHVAELAKAEAEGVERAGGKADIFQLEDTLSEEIRLKMHAGPQPAEPKHLSDPADLLDYDGFLIGVPTRYGNQSAQWRTFWDRAGKVWADGGYDGKYVGVFVSTGTIGGGQESTVLASISTFAHLGLIYVPLGYKHTFPQFANVAEVRGGSPWGAGTFAGADGSRSVSEVEKEVARIQGEKFYNTLARLA